MPTQPIGGTDVEKERCARDVYDDLLIEKRFVDCVGAHGQDLPDPKTFRRTKCSGSAQRLPLQHHTPTGQSAPSQELDQWSRVFVAVTDQSDNIRLGLLRPKIWSKGPNKAQAVSPIGILRTGGHQASGQPVEL